MGQLFREFRQVFLTPAGNRQVSNINSLSDHQENKKNEGFGKVFLIRRILTRSVLRKRS